MKETNLADWNFNSNMETPLTAEAQEIFDFYNDLKDSKMIRDALNVYYYYECKREILINYMKGYQSRSEEMNTKELALRMQQRVLNSKILEKE